jgi:hypothetical protein
VSAAQELWDQFRSGPYLVAYQPPHGLSITGGCRRVVAHHPLYNIIENQTPASHTQLVRAAAVMAVVKGDTEAAKFVIQGFAAVQGGGINYDGDVESLACLR